MLTALHITLPQRQRDDRSHPKHLPNRCLVVNEATCEASLISTEASLKYAAGNTDTRDSRESGTRFRFGHLAISPHHGSIFVTQVAPLLYDLCCKFFSTLQSSNKTSAGSTVFPMTGGKTTTAATQGGGGGINSHAHYIPQTEWEKNTSADAVSRRGAYENTYSMNRTIFIYGSHSATERRALFLHLAKATSLALLKETTNMSTQAQWETPRYDVSFSLVDVYHAWGVGDVLDVSAAMHDRSQLERLRRSQPRRSINEPKGIFFVEPTRQRLESRDDGGGGGAPAAILRALQRSDPPRGLHTRAERDDHAARSTLVLTFILSRRGDNYNCGESDRKRKGGGKQTATAPEARVHLILLADSAAAAHGKEKAQELAALAGVLQACTQWRREWISSSSSSMPPTDNNNNNTNTTEDNYIQPPDSGNVRKGRQMNVSSSSSARSKSPKLPWVPLRESPVLMYLFESTRYYTHHAEQSLHNLRQSKERRRLFGDKSGVMNGNISSSSCNAAKNISLSTTSLSEENNEYGGMGLDANNSNVLDCIAAGIGPCLLVVCVNSGWDQYYQARSAFLFVRRATNQNEVTMVHNNDNDNNNNNNNKSLDFKVVEMSHHIVQSDKRNNAHTVSSLPGTFIQSPCNRYQFVDEGEGRREGEGVAESIIVPLENTPSGVSRQLWSSPRQRETTEPRPQRHHHHHLEDSPVSHATLSDVPIICDQESDGNNNEGEGKDLSSHTSSQIMENINNNNNNNNNSVHQHSETPREHSASKAKNNPAFEASPHRNNSPPHPVQELFQCRQGHQCEEKSDYNDDDNNNNKNKSRKKKNDMHGDVDMDNETDSKSWEQPETTRNSQIAPVAFGLCNSPSASYSTTTKGVNVDSSSPVADANHLLRDVLQRQSSLMKENEQLRALLVNLSSQQAETNTREQRRATGIIDVCDVGMLASRGSASASELNKLRGELASTTKKARVLQRTLSRSLDENRKLRRVVHQEMKQCLVDVSRTFRDTMAERKTTSPVFTEERVNRWETMLKDTLNHLLQSERDEDAADNNNNNNNRENDEGLFAVAQECGNGGRFGSQQKSQGNQCMKKSLINSVCTTYTQQEPQKQPLESCCNESHKTVQIEADALLDEAEGTGRRACRRGIKFDDKLKSSVDKPSLNSQVVQLLQIAHRLFLCEPSCSSSSYDNDDDDNWTVDEAPRKVGEGVSDKTHLGSLSQSILEILSPRRHDNSVKNEARDREEERLLRKQKLKRDVCWKCHAESLHTRQSAEYIKFLETLRSLCRQVLVGGFTTTLLLSSSASCAHPQEGEEDVNEKTGTQASMHPAGRRGASPTTTKTKTIIKEATGTTGGLLGDEGSVLLKARQLSNSLHHRTTAREAEQTALQQMQSALEREREWRRQLQDELLSLRHHLSKYESRINFIDETVKPKLSNDIAQLEQRISERKKQHGLERERQRIFMSEIQKRLQRIISESEVNTFPSSSSTTSFLFSPQGVSAKSMR